MDSDNFDIFGSKKDNSSFQIQKMFQEIEKIRKDNEALKKKMKGKHEESSSESRKHSFKVKKHKHKKKRNISSKGHTRNKSESSSPEYCRKEKRINKRYLRMSQSPEDLRHYLSSKIPSTDIPKQRDRSRSVDRKHKLDKKRHRRSRSGSRDSYYSRRMEESPSPTKNSGRKEDEFRAPSIFNSLIVKQEKLSPSRSSQLNFSPVSSRKKGTPPPLPDTTSIKQEQIGPEKGSFLTSIAIKRINSTIIEEDLAHLVLYNRTVRKRYGIRLNGQYEPKLRKIKIDPIVFLIQEEINSMKEEEFKVKRAQSEDKNRFKFFKIKDKKTSYKELEQVLKEKLEEIKKEKTRDDEFISRSEQDAGEKNNSYLETTANKNDDASNSSNEEQILKQKGNSDSEIEMIE